MNGLIQDIRYALRQLRKSPGFTAVATLTLALGIGANSAIFTVVNAVLLKMLPAANPQQLVVLGDPVQANHRSNGTPRTDVFSYPLYKEMRDRNSVLSGLCAAASDHKIEVKAGSGTTSDLQVVGRMVSGNYFSVFGFNLPQGVCFLTRTIPRKMPIQSWCLVMGIGRASLRFLPRLSAKTSS